MLQVRNHKAYILALLGSMLVEVVVSANLPYFCFRVETLLSLSQIVFLKSFIQLQIGTNRL